MPVRQLRGVREDSGDALKTFKDPIWITNWFEELKERVPVP